MLESILGGLFGGAAAREAVSPSYGYSQQYQQQVHDEMLNLIEGASTCPPCEVQVLEPVIRDESLMSEVKRDIAGAVEEVKRAQEG